MAMFETWLKSDFQEDLTVEHLRGNFFSGDSLGNLVGVEVFDNGEPASLSGNVVGYVIRADGSTVVVSGTLSGNKASIILPACAYNVYGIMSIVIKVGSVTVGACTVHVYRSTTDTLVDPEHVIPSIDLLIQMVEECEQAVQTKADKVSGATNNHLAALDSYGNLKDSGKYATDFLASTLKGSANGVAELDINGKVLSSQLPSYVDDVLEYDSLSAFPATGETGKIYVAKDTNKTYRWSGTAYVEISPSLALGETSSTAYRGDRGKAAYDHATDAGRMTTAAQSGLYKVAVTDEGHVAGASPVQKSDITALGIPAQDTTYESKPAASGGTDESLVTTGEKYTWNQKYAKPSGGIPASDIASGVIPDVSGKLDKPSTAGSSGQVLTSDGQGGQSWQTPSSGTVTDVQEDGTSILSSGVANILTMTGASSSSAGTKGLVPAPSAGDDGKFLKGDGTWGNPSVSPSTIVDLVYPVGSIYMSVSSTSPATLFGGTWSQLKDRFLLGAGDTYTAGDTGGAASASYTPAGTVGGHTLTTDEIPSHNHSFTGSEVTSGNQSADHTHSYTDYYATTTGNCAITTAQTQSHSHNGKTSANDIYAKVGSWAGNKSGWMSITDAGYNNNTDAGTNKYLSGAYHSHSIDAVGSGNNHNHSGANTSTSRTSNGVSANHTHKVTASGSIGNKGGGGSHDHGFTGTAATIATMPPYLTVYMWKRTA